MKRKKKKLVSPPRRKAKIAVQPEAPTSCDVCGMTVKEIHCRLVCPKCGAMRDCSDP